MGSKKLHFKIGETNFRNKNYMADNQNKSAQSFTSYVSYSPRQLNALIKYERHTLMLGYKFQQYSLNL